MEILKVTNRIYRVRTATADIFFTSFGKCLSGIELFDGNGICGFLHGVNHVRFSALMEAAQ